MPDYDCFKKYSLLLIKNGEIIYHSKQPYLKPLIDCVNKYKGRLDGCTLYDKVVGLASAKLIVYAKIISQVITLVSTKPAVSLLKRNRIKINAQNTVRDILGPEKIYICPLEARAQKIKNNKQFFLQIKNIYGEPSV